MTTPLLPDTLTTARLRMRRVTRADLPFLTELHLDPEVTRYLGGDGSPRPPEKTLAWLEDTLRWYDADGVGQYLVEDASTGEPLGRAGYGYFEVERSPTSADGVPLMTWGPNSGASGVEVRRVLEVGYTFARASWGRGLASEAAAAWYAHALGERRAERVYSVIHPDNVGSRRVAEKNGLECVGPPARLEGRVYDLWSRAR